MLEKTHRLIVQIYSRTSLQCWFTNSTLLFLVIVSLVLSLLCRLYWRENLTANIFSCSNDATLTCFSDIINIFSFSINESYLLYIYIGPWRGYVTNATLLIYINDANVMCHYSKEWEPSAYVDVALLHLLRMVQNMHA